MPRGKYAFLSPVSLKEAGRGRLAAFEQMKKAAGENADYLTFREFERKSGKISRYKLIWLHAEGSDAEEQSRLSPEAESALKQYVEEGGSLFLTGVAVHMLNRTGIEPKLYSDSIKACKDDGYGSRLGMHAFMHHPLFDGLNGGAYLIRPPLDTAIRITGMFGSVVPDSGRVIAVDWDYIFLREESKLAFEYTPGKGKIVAVGAYVDFGIPNRHTMHLERFIFNCVRYLLRDNAGSEGTFWNYSPRLVTNCLPGAESDRLIAARPAAKSWKEPPDYLKITKRFAGEEFWDAAGERVLIMGFQQGGIEEVWAHPFMALRNLEASIRFSYRDTQYRLNDMRPEIEVHPGYFKRIYRFPRAWLTEIIVADPKKPTGVLHYEYQGVYDAQITFQFKSDLRLMWPYSDRVTGSICHGYSYDREAMSVQSADGKMSLMIGANRSPVKALSGQYSGFGYNNERTGWTESPGENIQVSGLLGYSLAMNDTFDLVFSASSESNDSTIAYFERGITDPEDLFRRATGHSERIVSDRLMLTGPDPEFNKGYRWALLSADRFYVMTPGMGKALTAGYSTTRTGWDGGHAINGRPGYGWYFGRDAAWSSLALLDCGDLEGTRDQLTFFTRFQDLTGKIFHEASTSGLVHYDAADATPLFILLAGRYFRHSNDTGFLRNHWPSIRKALDFCFSTDTDGDHLIENTQVGHGWVEGGKLYGSHSTIYMSGIWGSALGEASRMAQVMNDPEAHRYTLEAEEQRRIIDRDFWDSTRRFFAYGKNRDGTFRHEQTILPAVPIYFRMADRDFSRLAMRQIAGNNFTTNWGVRILREDNPWFKPTGYHYGSVWPLFTGWASLAEYSTGLSVQGFSHLMNNLVLYRHWGLGFAEEVLNGAEYKPSGVCPHQCWSETMVLQPAVEGLLGLAVDAPGNRVLLAPQLPPHWDSFAAERIRSGGMTFDLWFERKEGDYTYRFSTRHDGGLTLDFQPALPPGTRVIRVLLDGRIVPYTVDETEEQVKVSLAFTLSRNMILTVQTEQGIAVVPPVADPKPGDPPEGLRVVSSRLTNDGLVVELENRSGTSGSIGIWSAGGKPVSEEGLPLSKQEGKISFFTVVFPNSTEKYTIRSLTFRINQAR